MCRKGAWIELTVKVTYEIAVRREAHGFLFCFRIIKNGERGIRTLGPFKGLTAFRELHLKPLGHLSNFIFILHPKHNLDIGENNGENKTIFSFQ